MIDADDQQPEEPCVMPHAQPTRRWLGLLCARHYHAIQRSLTEIVELWALRGTTLLPGRSADDGRHSTRVGSPAPGNLAVMALSDPRMPAATTPGDVPDPLGILAGWARIVLDERGIRPLERRYVLTDLVDLLQRERRWIAHQPWIDDYAREINDIHVALAHATGAGKWAAAIGTCPNCGRPLYNTIGLDEVTCRRCRTVWAGVHLARLRLIHEQEARA